jgi:hypothetical protein
MEAWLTWSMPRRTHGQDHGRPQTPPLCRLAGRGGLGAASERVVNQIDMTART